jgi:hypothetical protein
MLYLTSHPHQYINDEIPRGSEASIHSVHFRENRSLQCTHRGFLNMINRLLHSFVYFRSTKSPLAIQNKLWSEPQLPSYPLQGWFSFRTLTDPALLHSFITFLSEILKTWKSACFDAFHFFVNISNKRIL